MCTICAKSAWIDTTEHEHEHELLFVELLIWGTLTGICFLETEGEFVRIHCRRRPSTLGHARLRKKHSVCVCVRVTIAASIGRPNLILLLLTFN